MGLRHLPHNYDPAWAHILHAIRAHILTSIEEFHKPLSWMRISAVDHQRILVHDDAARYDGLSVEEVREAFHALCTDGDPAAPSVAELLRTRCRRSCA
jgi:hypothetical protein